ncbi:MAG: AmmeMemoRadiSam system protein B [Pseudomonadota bacterium]
MSRVGFFPALMGAVMASLFMFISAQGGTPEARSADKGGPARIRKPAVAGAFYPADPQILKKAVADSLRSAEKVPVTGAVRAIMAPHAGYTYCSTALAAAYKTVEGESFVYERVVLVGPSHRFPTKAAALSSADSWETPLGTVPLDVAMCKKLVEKSDRVEYEDRAHEKEHCLEVQLPYLMAAARGKPFKIVPIVTSSTDASDRRVLADLLAYAASDGMTLMVLSTDLSHFPSAKDAEEVDKGILAAIASLNRDKLVEEDRKYMKQGRPGLSCTVCGLEAVLAFLDAAPALGITEAKVCRYSHSGMIGGDGTRVVGYGSIVFSGPEKKAPERKDSTAEVRFGPESRNKLIAICLAAAKAAVEGARPAGEPCDDPELQVRAGCFVTLKNKGILRGCIGRFTSDEPLWKTASEMAVASATQDGRFRNDPITPKEVPQLSVSVSVLSPMEQVSDPLKELELGRDGIVVMDKGRSGTFLPQVATETGWSLVEFLGHCSRDKAGLGWNGWKSPTAKVLKYTATIIEEEE